MQTGRIKRPVRFGAETQNRTADTRIFSPLLYQTELSRPTDYHSSPGREIVKGDLARRENRGWGPETWGPFHIKR
jgi:hypothetical protein